MITGDLGAIHDPTVLGRGHRGADGRIYVDRLVTLQGSREAPVQMAAVEQAIKDLAAAFAPVQTICIESWQGLAIAQSLQRLGWPVELFTPTAKSHSEEWPVLAQALAARTLVLPPHARLREELLNLQYEVMATGVKVVDRGRVHQDHAVVVRMLVARLARPARLGPLVWGGGLDLAKSADELQADEAAREAEVLAASAAVLRERLDSVGVFFPNDPHGEPTPHVLGRADREPRWRG